MDNKKMFMVLLFAIVFAVCLLFGIASRKAIKGHYDEMQKMNQGKANQIAFFTTLIFLETYFVYDYIMGDTFVRLSAAFLALITIVLGVTVYLAYSIWTNAYIQVNQNGTAAFILYAVLALLNLSVFFLNMDDLHITINNGILQFDSHFVQLAVAIVFGVCPVVFFVKKALDKREI